ncbi:MAG: hypothetical protein KDK78_04380, partial [Chlamydiia bacterium]|nr:hypothetical protein [Chlamydiia bacterium]
AHRLGLRSIEESSTAFRDFLRYPNVVAELDFIPCHLIDPRQHATSGVAGLILGCPTESLVRVHRTTNCPKPEPESVCEVEQSVRDLLEETDSIAPNRVWIKAKGVEIKGLWYKCDREGNPLITPGSLRYLQRFARNRKLPVVQIEESKREIYPLSQPRLEHGAFLAFPGTIIQRYGLIFRWYGTDGAVCNAVGKIRSFTSRESEEFLQVVADVLRSEDEHSDCEEDCLEHAEFGSIIATHCFEAADAMEAVLDDSSDEELPNESLKDDLLQAEFESVHIDDAAYSDDCPVGDVNELYDMDSGGEEPYKRSFIEDFDP